MKHLLLFSILISLTAFSSASEMAFADIQKRVALRNETTQAILAIDKRLRFSLTIEEGEAQVKIWKSMKVVDPNMEIYTFKVTPEIRQEYNRLELQKELQVFISKCSLLERKFRITNYKQHKVFLGMPYDDAIKTLGVKFKDTSSGALLGSYSLESDEYVIKFRSLSLYDIQKK